MKRTHSGKRNRVVLYLLVVLSVMVMASACSKSDSKSQEVNPKTDVSQPDPGTTAPAGTSADSTPSGPTGHAPVEARSAHELASSGSATIAVGANVTGNATIIPAQ